MGKLSYDPIIHHFSHQHPLELSTCPQTQLAASCSACKLSLSDWIYRCRTCNFFLHVACSQLPQLISHPADANHPLRLLPYPAYPEGYFNCNACGHQGNGFSYHCGTCDLDIHILCASKPLSVFHQSHHHPLNLTFLPPYQNKGFSCDICHSMGSNHWLYCCAACEFDAHLDCASSAQNPLVQNQVSQHHHQMRQTAATPSRYNVGAMPQVQAPPRAGCANGIQQNYMPNYYSNGLTSGVPQPVQQPARMNGPGNGLLDVAMQGFVDGIAQQVGPSLVQCIIGGDGGNSGGGGGGHTGGVADAGGGGVGGDFSSDAGSSVY